MSFVGGCSAISGGSVNSGGSKYQAARGLEDSVDIIYSDILKQGENKNDLRLARLYAEEVGPTFDWLVEDLGVEFQNEPYFAAEHTVQRAFKSKSNPLCYSTIQKLKDDCLERGVTLHLDTRAYELMCNEAGDVIGVKAKDTMTGQPYEFHGKAVILASGGFGANRELLSDNLSSCLFYGAVSSSGDGLKMATDIGAVTQNMTMGKCVPDGFEYAPGLGKSTSNSNKVAFLEGSAILLNYEGKRFAKETGEREVFAEQIRKSPTNMNYLFIYCTTGILGCCMMASILIILGISLYRNRGLRHGEYYMILYISLLFYAIWETVLFTYRFWAMMVPHVILLYGACKERSV